MILTADRGLNLILRCCAPPALVLAAVLFFAPDRHAVTANVAPTAPPTPVVATTVVPHSDLPATTTTVARASAPGHSSAISLPRKKAGSS